MIYNQDLFYYNATEIIINLSMIILLYQVVKNAPGEETHPGA